MAQPVTLQLALFADWHCERCDPVTGEFCAYHEGDPALRGKSWHDLMVAREERKAREATEARLAQLRSASFAPPTTRQLELIQ